MKCANSRATACPNEWGTFMRGHVSPNKACRFALICICIPTSFILQRKLPFTIPITK
jgi:hypothetical protein